MLVRRIKNTFILVFLLLLPAIVYQLRAAPPEPLPEANALTGETTDKPIIVGGMAEARSIIDTAAGQEALAASAMSEGFEGTWPPGGWQLTDDSGSDGGEYLWGRRDCQPHAGSFSGWSVGGGLQGSALDCAADYPNNAQSWAVYGPFDLSDAASASLSFYVWGATAGTTGCPWDYLFVGSSNDGLSFSGARYCGNWTNGDDGNGYSVSVLDLSGELGQSQVWVGFQFYSNSSVTNVGFTIDDVALNIDAPSNTLVYLPVIIKPGYPPASAPILNDIANSDGDHNYTVSWTAVSEATSYILEEDDNNTFSSPTIAYSGANTSTAISVGNTGTYHYRVKAVNNFGESSWSGVKSVEVTKISLPLFDTVLFLDNINDYAETSGDDSLLDLGDNEDFTVEAWFYTDSPNVFPAEIDVIACKWQNFCLMIQRDSGNPDRLMFQLWSSPTSSYISTVLLYYMTAGWHHLAATYDVNTNAMNIYYDGEHMSTSAFIGTVNTSDFAVTIGGLSGGNTLDGLIEEVRLSDVIRYSGATYAVPSEPFVVDGNSRALWRFDEPTGSTTFNGSSDNDHTAVGQNGAQTFNP